MTKTKETTEQLEIKRRVRRDLDVALRSTLWRLAEADGLTDAAGIRNGWILEASELLEKSLADVREAIREDR